MFKIMKKVSVVACALALICFAAFPVLSARTENRAYAAEENGVKLTAPAENETTIDVQAEETNAENAKSDSTACGGARRACNGDRDRKIQRGDRASAGSDVSDPFRHDARARVH